MMDKFLQDKNISSATAKKYGLHEKNGIIMFPVHRTDGTIKYTKYRKYSDGGHIMMPKGARTSIYGAHRLTDDVNTVVICEGETDVLALASVAPYPQYCPVTSTTGVMSFKKKWLDVLVRNYNIIVVYDNDTPGHKGMLRIWRMLYPEYNKVKFGFLTEYNDISDSPNHALDVIKASQPIEAGFKSHLGIEFEPTPEPVVYRRPLVLTREADNRRISAKQIPFNTITYVNSSGWAKCPFHNDSNPSMHWWKARNLMTCFVCGDTYDTIGFIMKLHKISFVQALDLLAPAPELQEYKIKL